MIEHSIMGEKIGKNAVFVSWGRYSGLQECACAVFFAKILQTAVVCTLTNT